MSHSYSSPRTRLQCFWGVCALASPPGYSPTICQAGSSLALSSQSASAALRPPGADEESCRVNRPLPNLISRPVRLTPVESLYIRLNGGDKRWAHSHFIPLGVRLLSVKSVTVFSLPFNNGAWVAVTITATRRSAQNFLHPTQRTWVYMLVCEENSYCTELKAQWRQKGMSLVGRATVV